MYVEHSVGERDAELGEYSVRNNNSLNKFHWCEEILGHLWSNCWINSNKYTNKKYFVAMASTAV